MNEKQLTCKQRIRAEFRSRMKDVRKLWTAYREGEEKRYAEDLGLWSEFGLSLSYVPSDKDGPGYLCFLMSWGGPQDEMRFYLDAELKAYRVAYAFLDLGDGAEIEVKGADLELWREVFADWSECETVRIKVEETAP